MWAYQDHLYSTSKDLPSPPLGVLSLEQERPNKAPKDRRVQRLYPQDRLHVPYTVLEYRLLLPVPDARVQAASGCT